MMPPQQESHLTARIPLTNRPENVSDVHADPAEFDHLVMQTETRGDRCRQSTPPPPEIQLQSGNAFAILHSTLHPMTLKFEDVAYSISMPQKEACGCLGGSAPKPDRAILNGVTGMVRPGEIMAMLGPSGCGKTTLLTALSGRLPGKITGAVTYNGHPFSSLVKRSTGFVTQDDVLYPHLTVVETLVYTAMLRLPNTLTQREKLDQAESVILELGLTRCRNSIIGGPLLRGLSGGERKRVSIGQEMLVNPSLLLLDEPTSGLDSTTAQRIMVTLQGLARAGRTIVTTIHQPSSRLYKMFDKVVVLSEGTPIYSGAATRALDYFESIGFVPGMCVNPADFLLDLANGVAPDARGGGEHVRPDASDQNSLKQSLMLSFKRNLYNGLKAEIRQNCLETTSSRPGKASNNGSEKHWGTSWWNQFKVLFCRGLKERKHESFSGLRIFQVISVAILSGLLWWHSDLSHIQDQVGLLFFFSIFWGFFPLFNAIFTFPQERLMLIKERSSGMYCLSSYYFARMAGDLPMELLLPTIFTVITYWMGGLKATATNFFLTLLVILYNVLVSQGLGQALGAILMDVKQATTLASVTMLTFLLAGGYYIQHIPPFIAWMKYISFSYYCYKLLLGVQYSEDEYYECGPRVTCQVLDYPAIKHMELGNKSYDVAVLTIMLVGFRLVAYLALRMGQPH
ncbi:ABC transporter G family member 21-like [Aristolochia californica]|uniref:ABC transporter G family member 21-like n=1 Tax=Aristolochia californica TaxID=171875 RepID=UPI0035D76D7C